ncbi:hypothetical protein MKZ38_008393 [Zalerion maritima]|uniref:Mid2 domain-containing protein n=1 Tax=Zalerion maritima TaxID=339359 RepID=A0AAD5RHZ2_9PEZI|nr:hypothetical protein MKZ38_008393 [Zalerion maritima]
MRISQAFFLGLFVAAAHAHPVDPDEVAPAPVSTADASVPTITAPPEQVDIELEKRQDVSDDNSTTPEEDNSTTPEDNVTQTTTVTVLATVTDFATITTQTTSTSTVIGTSTVFTTVTETVSDIDTATKTVYTTISTGSNDKRWIQPRATVDPRAFGGYYHMQPRAVIVNVVKRDTIFVTATESDETTIEATTTDVRRVVVKTTSYTTIESTITTTSYENAKTTVTTTSTIVITTLTEDANPTYTEESTATGTDGSIQTSDSSDSSSDSDSDSGSSGLSNGAKIGIGVGVGVVGLFVIAAVVYYAMKKRRNGPEPEWYDPHSNDINDNANMPPPTVPAVEGETGAAEMGESSGGYRGASGPGTGGLAAGGAAAGGAAALGGAGRGGRKSWGGSSGPTVSPPSRFTTPAADATPYPTGSTNAAAPAGYAEMPNEPGRQQPINEMDGGQMQHAVEADSRPVVFEAPDRKYT